MSTDSWCAVVTLILGGYVFAWMLWKWANEQEKK